MSIKEGENLTKSTQRKYVSTAEMVLYFMGTFLLTNMQGLLGNYRQAYLTNVLDMPSGRISFVNVFCSIGNFVLCFFLTMYIDRAPKPGKAKFKPYIKIWIIPMGVSLVLLFYTPSFIDSASVLAVIYCILIQMVYFFANAFATTLNNVAVVMTPNTDERDTVLTFRGIVNAIGNSAPLVIILVAGFITENEGLQYIGCAALCSLAGIIFVLAAERKIKERVAYNPEHVNPIVGYADVLKNKSAWVVIISEFLKNFRMIATYMGIFLAAALLGSTSKYLLFGLPTGIGTMCGMLIVKAFMKKFNTKQIYIASGVYSVIINTLAFFVGVEYFKTENGVLQIVFIGTLFLIGLQFGASNLLPALFQADILEEIELETNKRLDMSLAFVCTIGSTISGTIASGIAPVILSGEHSIIGYIRPIGDVYQTQNLKTKILLLFFYTIFHGIMMLLAGLPFFFYHLTGKRKEEIHEQVLALREKNQLENTGTLTQDAEMEIVSAYSEAEDQFDD